MTTQQAAFDALLACAECEQAYDELASAAYHERAMETLRRHGWNSTTFPLVRPWLVRKRAEALKLAAEVREATV